MLLLVAVLFPGPRLAFRFSATRVHRMTDLNRLIETELNQRSPQIGGENWRKYRQTNERRKQRLSIFRYPWGKKETAKLEVQRAPMIEGLCQVLVARKSSRRLTWRPAPDTLRSCYGSDTPKLLDARPRVPHSQGTPVSRQGQPRTARLTHGPRTAPDNRAETTSR